MRRLLTTITILLTAIPLMNAQNLTRLWKEYDDARAADRPRTQMQVLEQIEAEALAQRLPWDYYRACTNYVSVASSVNWKLRDSLDSQLDRQIREFGEPVLVLHYLMEYRYSAGTMEYLSLIHI